MATVDTPKPVNSVRQQRQPDQPKQPEQKVKSVWSRIGDRWRDVLSEIQKITWPSPQETRNLTIVVMGISAAVGIVLSLIDGGLTLIISQFGK